jgi:hypothetical protein
MAALNRNGLIFMKWAFFMIKGPSFMMKCFIPALRKHAIRPDLFL